MAPLVTTPNHTYQSYTHSCFSSSHSDHLLKQLSSASMSVVKVPLQPCLILLWRRRASDVMTTLAVWNHRRAKSSPTFNIRQTADKGTPSTHNHMAN